MTGANTYRLSPYCVIHLQPDNQTLALVHGLHGSRFELSSLLLPALAALVNGATLEAALSNAPPEARIAVDTLIAEKVLIAIGSAGDDEDHFRNRLGPLELAVQRGFNEGGYYSAEVDHAHPPSALKTVPAREYLDLDRGGAGETELSVERCLSARRSVRHYGAVPMPRRTFERFLDLSARAHALVETPDLGWISSRNYPSGGARYPLEIHPLVYHVEGVEAGLYHYDPFGHRLGRLEIDPQHSEVLLADALRKMGGSEALYGRPAVLFLITAVYARTCWKYRGIPYQLLLMETGALYQTMYLVGTALGLAPCAVGAFPELAVAELLELDVRDEGQVGLFALGVPDSRAPENALKSITAARLIVDSPPGAPSFPGAVELSFSDGSREIIEPARLRLRADDDGVTHCTVRRERDWARVDESVAANLRRWLQEARPREA
jgi:SagB-type dehydrogenase family enzyme